MANNRGSRGGFTKGQGANDEFYTQYKDVEWVVNQFKDFFKGKSVYCPCDDYHWSNFPRYFKEHFEELGITKISSSCYSPKKWGIGGGELWTYNGVEETVTALKGDGNVLSNEVLNIAALYDVIITNPPFSIARKIMNEYISRDIKFIVLNPTITALVSMINHNLKVGGVKIGDSMYFISPSGKKLTALAQWVTNIGPFKEVPKIPLPELKATGRPKETGKFVGCQRVRRIKDIPADYNDWIQVPFTIFNYNYEDQFELKMLKEGQFIIKRKETNQYEHPQSQNNQKHV